MFKDFVNLIYPLQCAGCNSPLVQSEKAICSGCWMELKNFDQHDQSKFLYHSSIQYHYFPLYIITRIANKNSLLHCQVCTMKNTSEVYIHTQSPTFLFSHNTLNKEDFVYDSNEIRESIMTVNNYNPIKAIDLL